MGKLIGGSGLLFYVSNDCIQKLLPKICLKIKVRKKIRILVRYVAGAIHESYVMLILR